MRVYWLIAKSIFTEGHVLRNLIVSFIGTALGMMLATLIAITLEEIGLYGVAVVGIVTVVFTVLYTLRDLHQ